MPPVRSNKPHQQTPPAAVVAPVVPTPVVTPAAEVGGPAPSETHAVGAWENEGGMVAGKGEAAPDPGGGAAPGKADEGVGATGMADTLKREFRTEPPAIKVTRIRVALEVPMLRFDDAPVRGRAERIDLALNVEESRGFLLLQQALNDEKTFQGYGTINKQEPIKWLLRRLAEAFDGKAEVKSEKREGGG